MKEVVTVVCMVKHELLTIKTYSFKADAKVTCIKICVKEY